MFLWRTEIYQQSVRNPPPLCGINSERRNTIYFAALNRLAFQTMPNNFWRLESNQPASYSAALSHVNTYLENQSRVPLPQVTLTLLLGLWYKLASSWNPFASNVGSILWTNTNQLHYNYIICLNSQYDVTNQCIVGRNKPYGENSLHSESACEPYYKAWYPQIERDHATFPSTFTSKKSCKFIHVYFYLWQSVFDCYITLQL